MNRRPARFPFLTMFQNGRRHPGSAAGRSEDLPMRRERGQLQKPNHSQFTALCGLPLAGPEPFKNLA